jgi:hypothetical protein
VEQVYAGMAQKEVPDDVRKKLPLEKRAEHSVMTVQVLVGSVDSAIREGTFDRRPDRHLSCTRLLLDEAAWKKLQDILSNAQREVDALREEASAQHDDPAGPASQRRIHATVGLLGFESPTPPWLDE